MTQSPQNSSPYVSDSEPTAWQNELAPSGLWTSALEKCSPSWKRRRPLVAVLPGEGIGPEIIAVALRVLKALERVGGATIQVETGGLIGKDSERAGLGVLPGAVVKFCEGVFERGGVVLNGPGGGRYVYDLRRQFDLNLKISPVQITNGLADSSPLKDSLLTGLDLLIVRENVGGVYQGLSEIAVDAGKQETVSHTFSYAEADVRRFLEGAAHLALQRKCELTVVYKDSGVPAISALWRRCSESVAKALSVSLRMVDMDLMAYQLIQAPQSFDVIAAPNLCGDVLADLAANLLGSRGLSFSGNFSPQGHAVYQTNHGAAYDLAGKDVANPGGQILSLAMLLRESLGLPQEAAALEVGLRSVWREGWRTADTASARGKTLGTKQMGELVAQAAVQSFQTMATAAAS